MSQAQIPTVAVIAPGDMGHGVARRLVENGVTVLTSLAGRSARSRRLAEVASMQAVEDDSLAARTDILLSIVPPGEARALAGRIADLLKQTGQTLLYADCNAVSPGTIAAIEATITGAGGRFVDVGIFGPPPKPGTSGPRLFASGAEAANVAVLKDYGLDFRILGPQTGQASALKMCYGAITKGMTALGTEMMAAARLAGVEETLKAEMTAHQPQVAAFLDKQMPSMPPKAYRWVAEMDEIAATFRALGLPGTMLEGAARLYDQVAASPMGKETPEERTMGKTADEVGRLLAEFVRK